jgi:molybdate transport system ATP-binding protein
MSVQVELHNHFPNFALDVEFTLNEGVLGLLGPSGCGKSMTLRCISGVERPAGGRVVLNGRRLFDSKEGVCLPPQQRRVGHLFQSYALFPNMSVEQNLLCGIGRKNPNREEKLRQLLEQFQLTELRRLRPGQLSGGQQQRCALARCLGADPELLLLDEPFSALDAHLRTSLQLQLKEHLERYRRPAILVTHDRDEAYLLCDRIAVMDRGRILTTGTREEVFRSPGSPTAARLTGCKNVVSAQAKGERQVYVPQWGCTLTTAEQVPPQLTHIGVRAHDLTPVSAPGENTVTIAAGRVTEYPFEWSVLLAAAAGGQLHWKVSKEHLEGALPPQVPAYVAISPEKLLLLRG